MGVNPRYRGWKWNPADSTLDVYIGSTKVAAFGASAITLTPATTVTGGVSGNVTGDLTGEVSKPVFQKATATATAGADTLKLTAAQVLSGLIVSTPTEAQAMTFPDAADLIAALPNAGIGANFDLIIRNTAGGSYAITATAGTGNTLIGGAATIAQNKAAVYRVIQTAADAVTYIRIGDEA